MFFKGILPDRPTLHYQMIQHKFRVMELFKIRRKRQHEVAGYREMGWAWEDSGEE